eukprot:2758735-Prorocentrum_lima.AAC.1
MMRPGVPHAMPVLLMHKQRGLFLIGPLHSKSPTLTAAIRNGLGSWQQNVRGPRSGPRWKRLDRERRERTRHPWPIQGAQQCLNT